MFLLKPLRKQLPYTTINTKLLAYFLIAGCYKGKKGCEGYVLFPRFSHRHLFCALKGPESSEYPGPYPASETETQLIMQLIEDNLDAQVVLDYHNIGKGYPLFYVYGQKEVQLAYGVFSTLTDKWQQEDPRFPKDRILGRVRPNGHEGMLADYLISKNLWVLTTETPWCMPDVGAEKYVAPTIRYALEVLVNTILAIVQNAK